ncbi:hypothetical protein [Streptomyces sp. NPDC020917]|uniref:hypothetical protein n=1 Tax=Streptomyces sp. NPDC020917 TaxID=3365102 RepID=UPI0037B009B2
MIRADLRALTPDTLAALANRGLVKRAEKDLASGSGPAVTTGDDGTVRGAFPDGTATELPPGTALDAAGCTCGARGVCRHRIGLVLAYQRDAWSGAHGRDDLPEVADGQGAGPEAAGPQARRGTAAFEGHGTEKAAGRDGPRPVPEASTPGSAAGGTQAGSGESYEDWSPGAFDDDALTAALGRPALTAARRARDRGYSARLHRPRPGDPVPRVELPTCTVSFPVPHELGYALTDASGPLRGEVVTLAVWAFRAADARRTGRRGEGQPTGQAAEPEAETVTVGGRAAAVAGADEALRDALGLAADLLLDGVQQAGPVFSGSLRRCREALSATARHWPAGAVADLEDQLDAYAARSTRYDAERFALLIAELHARHRAAGRDPVQVLGTQEAPTTPLRRVRLVALGCRIRGGAEDRTAETYFAHPGSGIALVLRKRWELTDGQEPTGHDLSGRRLLGSPLHALATANVVSEHASRAADRTIALSRGRIAATSVTPVGAAWTELPGSLLLHDVAAHLAAAGDPPPRLIRPRVEAESVRVVAVAAVEAVGYEPAGQRLEAVVRDPAGSEIVVRAEHDPLCPGRLDALAAALGGGDVRCVSGMLGRDRGRPVLDPLAVLTADGVVVPDLAPGSGDGALPAARSGPSDPITGALEAARAALADAAHQGLRRLTATSHDGLAGCAADLQRTGLGTAAQRLRDLESALRLRPAAEAVPAWVDAHLHLTLGLELHQQSAPSGP